MNAASVESLVKTGFRPANLPPKSDREKEQTLAHVEAVITGDRKIYDERIARESQRKALDALWRTELMTGRDLLLTDQMRRLWEEYGLPSQFVRCVVWPWSASGFARVDFLNSATDELAAPSADILRLIEIDVKRTLPFMGFHRSENSSKEEKCIQVLRKFSVLHPKIGYTQGMSYVCVRLMMELDFDAAKTMICLERILIASPTVSSMYRLDLGEIKNGAEFVLDSIAWENVPRLWMYFKSIKFAVVDWFFLEWTLTMFVKNFSAKFSAFILDLFFLSGDVVLYKAAIAALSLVQDELLAVDDVETIRGVIGEMGGKIIELEIFSKIFHEVTVPVAILDLIAQGVVFHRS